MKTQEEYVTKKDLESLEARIGSRIERAVDDLSEVISQLAQSVHSELVDVRTDISDLRADHGKQLRNLNEKV